MLDLDGIAPPCRKETQCGRRDSGPACGLGCARCVAACTMCGGCRKPHIMRHDTLARFGDAEAGGTFDCDHAAIDRPVACKATCRGAPGVTAAPLLERTRRCFSVSRTSFYSSFFVRPGSCFRRCPWRPWPCGHSAGEAGLYPALGRQPAPPAGRRTSSQGERDERSLQWFSEVLPAPIQP